MHRSLWTAVTILSLVCGSTGHAQTAPSAAPNASPEERPCRLVTPEDVSIVLGSDNRKARHACQWQGFIEGHVFYLTISIVEEGWDSIKDDLSAVDRLKKGREATAHDGSAVQDEPSLGKGAFSGRKDDLFGFALAVKDVVLHIGIQTHEGQKIPPALFDKLRDLAKKVASRFA